VATVTSNVTVNVTIATVQVNVAIVPFTAVLLRFDKKVDQNAIPSPSVACLNFKRCELSVLRQMVRKWLTVSGVCQRSHKIYWDGVQAWKGDCLAYNDKSGFEKLRWIHACLCLIVLRDLTKNGIVREALCVIDMQGSIKFKQWSEMRIFISELFRTECTVLRWIFSSGAVEHIVYLAKGHSFHSTRTPHFTVHFLEPT